MTKNQNPDESSKKSYHDRKPDIETESFRIWKPKNKQENKEMDALESESERISITLKDSHNKDVSFTIHGFNKVYRKKHDENGKNNENDMILAFKYKHNEHMILYYTPYDNDINANKILFKLQSICDLLQFSLVNVMEHLNTFSNDYGLRKMAGDKNENKK